MKKYDSLLTKVELFHKLAMYGDRRAFLQALAQDRSGLVSQLETGAQQFLNDIQGRWDQVKFKTNITVPFMRLQSLLNRAKDTGDSRSLQQVPGLMDEVLGAVQSENVMPEAMDALHQLRESVGVAANQMSNAVPAGGDASTAPAGESSEQRMERLKQKYQEMSAPGKSAPNYGDPETVKLLQTFLGSSLGIDALGPKGIDGKMGPDTIKALRQWATSNGVTAQDVGQLMQIALSKANYGQKANV
jgi:hypothetical protein